MSQVVPDPTDASASCPSPAPVRSIRFKLLVRMAILLAGLFLGQVILFGPSLCGRKILLPLDILTQPGVYAPVGSAPADRAHDPALIDLVCLAEPNRLFAGTELRAGRWPLWNPNQFAGAPAVFPRFSPLVLLLAWVRSPVIIAWVQLLAATVAGTGAYAFFRRALGLSFWPATFAAWVFPLTGFFIVWQGFGCIYPVIWLPWLLLAVDSTVRRPRGIGGLGVAAATAMVLVSGQLDVAGQVLLVSGLYALWRLGFGYAGKWLSRPALAAVCAIVIGWTLGFLFAAPEVLFTVDYSQTGSRMSRRAAGNEERPPVGIVALPQVIIPRIHGSTELGSMPLFPETQPNLQESSVGAFVGILATLLLAPLAWLSRRHRSSNAFCLLLFALGLGWTLNVPGLVQILRIPPLNMMSHNRLVFASAFALVALAAVGLDAVATRKVRWNSWFWLPLGLCVAVAYWSVIRLLIPPEPIATRLDAALRNGQQIHWVRNAADILAIKDWFATGYAMSLLLSGLSIAGWLLIRFQMLRAKWPVFILGALVLGELCWFGAGRSAQCDPALYYPQVPALEQVARSAPGRVIGYSCLPARLGEMAGLRDIRGYDAVDPVRLMEVMEVASVPKASKALYARTQWFVPKVSSAPPDGIRLSPVLDMLGVRYVILRGTPFPEMAKTRIQSPDYWVPENRAALPRAFIPARVELAPDAADRLAKMASSEFDPRKVAYVETPVDLPAACRGAAEIVAEIPTHVTVSARMETAGLLVLADLWDSGWNATINGHPAPILRANHAIRGVVLPAGTSTVEFCYAPASWTWGIVNIR